MKKYVLFMLMFLLLSPLGFAATQGTLGGSSTGSVLITLNINPAIQISNLTDIVINYVVGVSSGNATGFSPACVYSNSTTKNYSIKATSTNASGGNMRVSTGGGSPSYINYTAQWFTNPNATGGTPVSLTNGTAVNISGATANNTSPNCSNGASNNASVLITFLSADLSSATQGSYTDTLTLLVTPI